MRNPVFQLLCFSLCFSNLIGCQVLDSLHKPKVDNPVLSQNPIRTMGLAPEAESEFNPHDPQIQNSGLQQISLEAVAQGETMEVRDDLVVAKVNGSPIFAAEILDPYTQAFEKMDGQLSPEQMEQQKLALLQRDLKTHVQRKLLVNALKSTVEPDQFDQLLAIMYNEFEKQEVERLKEQLEVDTVPELEQKLAEQKTTLASLRDNFVNQEVARQFLALKARADNKVTRQELLQYYQEHLQDYESKPKVRWQELIIYFDNHGGRDEALALLSKAIDELRQGAEFTTVVQKYSDGVELMKDGIWDWMEPGSLDSQEVEKSLFELPVGSIGSPFEHDTSFQLVKVLEREEKTRKQFPEVQQDIQLALLQQKRRNAIEAVFKELIDEAEIVTIFDEGANDPKQWYPN